MGCTFIIQLIFLQQYFSIPVLCNIMIVILLQSMCLSSELLGTLCEKKHNAIVVMDNKYFITLVRVLTQLLHSWAAFSLAFDT